MAKRNSVFRSLKRTYDRWRRERRYLAAIRSGRYVPPPQSVKMRILEENTPIPRPRVFIETGTYFGDTVHEMKTRYLNVVSMELDRALYDKARKRFEADDNVHLVHGDCVHELPGILAHLSEAAVFWLDGHWSGKGTGRGEVEDPILISLDQIRRHPVRDHVIFIDDARCFDGRDGRPDIVRILSLLKGINDSYRIRIQSDIIVASTRSAD